MPILICPICGNALHKESGSFLCPERHSFDLAKEGYLNLLAANRHKSRHPGDAPELCRARRAFLSAGYYAPLRALVADRLCGRTVLDACCGEGYYTSAASERQFETYGFDIAKDMIRLAAKRDKQTQYFVAGLHQIPVRTESADTLMHLFAPFHDAEFTRVLQKGGTLLSVLPGEQHLMGLKKVLYEVPYPNAEKLPDCSLPLVRKERLRYDICLENSEDILHLFGMTPYSYKTARSASEKLSALPKLETTVDFLVLTYRKS